MSMKISYPKRLESTCIVFLGVALTLLMGCSQEASRFSGQRRVEAPPENPYRTAAYPAPPARNDSQASVHIYAPQTAPSTRSSVESSPLSPVRTNPNDRAQPTATIGKNITVSTITPTRSAAPSSLGASPGYNVQAANAAARQPSRQAELSEVAFHPTPIAGPVPAPPAAPTLAQLSADAMTPVPTAKPQLNAQAPIPQSRIAQGGIIKTKQFAVDAAHVDTSVASSIPSTNTQDLAASPEFRWPAHGRIIQGYKSGSNDGINIALPQGSSVKAVESGVVAYSGDLKGYGNLILVRHTNGFVSVYANNSSLEVKKGDVVKRGQIVAKSGQTGNVSSPQLHFELRKGGQTPVDPSQYLAGL